MTIRITPNKKIIAFGILVFFLLEIFKGKGVREMGITKENGESLTTDVNWY